MPTTFPPGLPPARVLPRLTRKTVLLLTVLTSIGPLKGIERRGCRLKPSSVLIAAKAVQSDGRSAQFGKGKFTLSPVFWLGSATVKRSLGNGPPAGFSISKRAWTLPCARVNDDWSRQEIKAIANKLKMMPGMPGRLLLIASS